MKKSLLNLVMRPHAQSTMAALVAAMLALSAGAVRAEDPGAAGGHSDAASPVDQFSQQLEAFQKSVPDLTKSIQESTGAIDSSTNVEKARAEMDKLRATVSTLLGAVSDNGPVSRLGAKALDHIGAKLKALSQDNRFKPQERQFLISQWRKLEGETENATKELDDARAQFAGLLKTLQDNEDFIGELIEIRQAQKALQVIHDLTHQIREASAQLNKLIGGIKAPGT